MTSEKRAGEVNLENFPRWLIPTAIGVIAIAFAAFTYRQGVSTSPDTTTYSKWADLLISRRFNYLEFASDTTFVVPLILYLGWINVVALFKLLLGAHWMSGIVVFNYGLTLLAVTLLLNLIKRITRSALCVVAAGALTLIAYELFQWIHYALSDTSFVVLTFTVFYLLCEHEEMGLSKTGHILSKRKFLLALLVILTLLYRPTGLPVLLLTLLAYLTRRVIQGKSRIERTSMARRVGAGLCLLIISGIVLHAYFMMNPLAWPFNFASSWIQRLSGEYYQGYVVFQRVETYYLNPVSLIDFITITLMKLAFFFSFYSSSFSLAHNLINLAFFLPAYALALFAIYRIFQTDCKLTAGVWWSGWIALWWIIFFALYHASQQIDYDWRYRLPCMLPLILLASAGLKSALHREDKPAEKSQPWSR
jgi:hypothetical protein